MLMSGVTDTLTITLEAETAERLRMLAAERGESVEALAERLLAGLTSEIGASDLNAEQLADLRRRLDSPLDLLSRAESDAFFDRLLVRSP